MLGSKKSYILFEVQKRRCKALVILMLGQSFIRMCTNYTAWRSGASGFTISFYNVAPILWIRFDQHYMQFCSTTACNVAPIFFTMYHIARSVTPMLRTVLYQYCAQCCTNITHNVVPTLHAVLDQYYVQSCTNIAAMLHQYYVQCCTNTARKVALILHAVAPILLAMLHQYCAQCCNNVLYQYCTKFSPEEGWFG